MNLHDDFLKQIHSIIPNEEDAFLDALQDEASVSIRLNAAKCDALPTLDRVPWCSLGHYLPARIPFTFDPAFQSGLYYVQDASSMFLQYVVKTLVHTPVRYLDACAAPGGKSTAALDVLPQGSLMVSNEYIAARAHVLRENIIKWGSPNCVVTNNDCDTLGALTHYFDVIAADVPCSGEGMFRKDEEAVSQWSTALVEQCADRQRLIVDALWNAISPGGLMIYSTCTYNRVENEEMVEYIIGNHDATSVNLDVPAEWNIHGGIDTPHHCYRFMPHRTRGEGLFLSVIRKGDNDAHDAGRAALLSRKKTKSKAKVKLPPIPADTKNWLDNNANGFSFTQHEDSFSAVPAAYTDDIAMLRDKLHVIHAGVTIGTIKGHDYAPSQSLALSTAVNRAAFPACDVDYATAIAYLRGETVIIDAPRGFVLIIYHGAPLGFVKNLGNRANNLYSKELRIKSTHIPDIPPSII